VRTFLETGSALNGVATRFIIFHPISVPVLLGIVTPSSDVVTLFNSEDSVANLFDFVN